MYFLISRSDDGGYYWEFVGDDNETIAVSGSFQRKALAEDAIGVIQKDAPTARVIDMSGSDRYRRRLP
jgi:uncharacterized protein YegP (UPF0339 family)